MSAYMIFMRDKTLDEHELATYSKELLATLDGHEVKVLALHGSHEDPEGIKGRRNKRKRLVSQHKSHHEFIQGRKEQGISPGSLRHFVQQVRLYSSGALLVAKLYSAQCAH
jgi:hypothetical protein